jgi:poly(3-hydroxybutyrate) depolymerase
MTPLPTGTSSYVLADPRGGNRSITVQFHRPAALTPRSRVLIVMHGRGRNGADYRNWWIPEAERYGALLAVPEFSERDYAHPEEYNYGAMFTREGELRPRGEWLFPVVDHVFEDVRRRAGVETNRYFLFGHSAGSQVVHRMVTFGWSERIERAVAANAGAYTLPRLDESFPFGLGGTGFGELELKQLLSRPMLVLLGEADNDPSHHQLPREPAAMRQGPHRFARGQHYFATARREAERLGVHFGWKLATVPGVAHSGELMAAPAARHLFADAAVAAD